MDVPNSGPGVLLLSIGGFPFVVVTAVPVVRMSRALRDQAVCRLKLFIEFGDNSVSITGVDVSIALLGTRKLRLLSYGLLLSVVVDECIF